MRERWLTGLVLAGATMLSAAASERYTIVTQVNGEARSTRHQLALLDRLAIGDMVTLDDGASLVLFRVGQGQQFTLTGPGKFTLGGAGPVRQGATGGVRLDRTPPAFARVQRGDQVVAGAVVRAGRASDEVERIAPSKPLFSWRTRPHRGLWTFRLTDEGGEALFETTLAATELSLPARIRLDPGRTYLREIRWIDRDGITRIEATPVRMLDAADDAELRGLYPTPRADQAARVLYALYLRDLGVHALAARVAPEIEAAPSQ